MRHHLQPVASFENWDRALAQLPDVPWLAGSDFLPFEDRRERARLAARIDLAPVDLDDGEIADLVAFLHSLTGTQSIKPRLGKPERVPSGLEVE